jgi:hypothetical protein
VADGAAVGALTAGGEDGVAAGAPAEGVAGVAAGAAGEDCEALGVAGAACCAALLTIVKGAQALSTKIRAANRPRAKALEIMTRPFSLELSGFACLSL